MIWRWCIGNVGRLKSAWQTAHQSRSCIKSSLEIKVSAGALLRLTEWIRQRSESSKFTVQTEQGGVECQIPCPSAPNEGSGEIELCIVGRDDRAAGAALDADAVHSAAGNAAATDADAGSAAGRASRSRSLMKTGDEVTVRRKDAAASSDCLRKSALIESG